METTIWTDRNNTLVGKGITAANGERKTVIAVMWTGRQRKYTVSGCGFGMKIKTSYEVNVKLA